MVEDMLAARGIIVSHQTVWLWAEKFCRAFAASLRESKGIVITTQAIEGPGSRLQSKSFRR